MSVASLNLAIAERHKEYGPSSPIDQGHLRGQYAGFFRSPRGNCASGARDRGPRPALSGLIRLQPCGLGMVAGKLRGAPLTEKGPKGLGCRAILLRTMPDSRLRACPFGMEEVTSGAIVFCSESTFAMSVEI